MIKDDEKPAAAESVPEAKSRLTPLIAVSVLLGFLLGLGGVMAYVGYEGNRALQAEVDAARADIKKKNAEIEDLQGQIEALSAQIGALKEYSVARSRNGGPAKPPPATAPTGAEVPVGPKTAFPPSSAPSGRESPGRSATVASAVPKDARRKIDVQNCDLVGKSPEEQAETLKRCVSAMDSVAGARRVDSAR